MKKLEAPTWIEINTRVLRANFLSLKAALSSKTKVICVVKGNAYGHGMSLVAKTLAKERPDYFAVFSFEEALLLRKDGIRTPILVLSPAQKEWIKEAVQKNITLTASSLFFLQALKSIRTKKPLTVHVHVETGLGREGVTLDQISKVLALVHQNKNVYVEGLCTHFSGAESRVFDRRTKEQVEKLFVWKKAFASLGMYPLLHASGTAGSLIHKEYELDMVRFGLGLYGLWPSEETKALPQAKKIILKPVLSWKVKISEIKILPKYSGIGYDATFMTKKETRIAVLPVGYYDGLPRDLSSKIECIVDGKKAPQRGRIMMNTCVIDVTDIPKVREGDAVTLLGSHGKETISAEKLAASASTINYEIVTRIRESIPRIQVLR